MEEKCTVVLQSFMQFKCYRRWIKFGRWSGVQAEAKLQMLPDQVWSMESVKGVLNELYGDLMKIIPPKNRRVLGVMAWLHDPCIVGEVVKVEIH